MKVAGVIPARYESSRFSGKPLADLCGKPMIQHVYERVRQSETLFLVAVATDDDRIVKAVEKFGGRAILTGKQHRSGTDRIAEAASLLELDADDIVVNVQGDQPLILPSQIAEVAGPLMTDSSLPMATLIYRIRREEEITHPHAVKVVFDDRHFALYFSRATIPYVRDRGQKTSYYKHHGIYAYRRSFLDVFSGLPEGRWEKLEALEQLRVLEGGYRIKVVETEYDSVEVDSPEELARVCDIIMNNDVKVVIPA